MTRDKEICQSHIILRWWHQYLLGQSTQQNPLKEFYLLPKFDVSSFSMAGDIYFQTGQFAALSSSKLMAILLTLGKSKLTLLIYFHYFGQIISILLSLGKMLSCKKTIQTQSKPSPFDKNFKNHLKDLTQVIFNDSISGNQYNLVLQLLNRLHRFNLLFLSVTCFSDLRDKIKYAW